MRVLTSLASIFIYLLMISWFCPPLGPMLVRQNKCSTLTKRVSFFTISAIASFKNKQVWSDKTSNWHMILLTKSHLFEKTDWFYAANLKDILLSFSIFQTWAFEFDSKASLCILTNLFWCPFNSLTTLFILLGTLKRKIVINCSFASSKLIQKSYICPQITVFSPRILCWSSVLVVI